jgi:hypothetical protein
MARGLRGFASREGQPRMFHRADHYSAPPVERCLPWLTPSELPNCDPPKWLVHSRGPRVSEASLTASRRLGRAVGQFAVWSQASQGRGVHA